MSLQSRCNRSESNQSPKKSVVELGIITARRQVAQVVRAGASHASFQGATALATAIDTNGTSLINGWRSFTSLWDIVLIKAISRSISAICWFGRGRVGSTRSVYMWNQGLVFNTWTDVVLYLYQQLYFAHLVFCVIALTSLYIICIIS